MHYTISRGASVFDVRSSSEGTTIDIYEKDFNNKAHFMRTVHVSVDEYRGGLNETRAG